MARFSMDMFGYILFSFLDSCPDFILFRHKCPPCRFQTGNGTGGGALDKVGRDCYHKSRKSVATSGWLFVSANNYIYAGRLAPPRQSVRFYRTERAPLLAVGSTRFAQIDDADRSVAAERSARFYGQVYKTPCVGSRSGTAQGGCFWGQVVWWAGSSR